MTVFLETAAPLSESEIDAVESRLGVKLPADYRKHLLAHNGGRPRPDGFDIAWDHDCPAAEEWRTSCLGWFLAVGDMKHSNLYRYNAVTFKGRIPDDTLAIAHDAGGNLILLALAGIHAGKVLFWVRDYEAEAGEVFGYGNIGLIAENFRGFIDHGLRA